jgi:PBP1b-binding outer membrane lipoprotein LpoB
MSQRRYTLVLLLAFLLGACAGFVQAAAVTRPAALPASPVR